MKESVIYQEILREGLQKGLQQGLQEGLQEGLQQGLQEGLQEGLQQGLQAEVNLIVRQLTRRLGIVPQALQKQIQSLSIAQLEDLGEALLDFSTQSELEQWLSQLVD